MTRRVAAVAVACIGWLGLPACNETTFTPTPAWVDRELPAREPRDVEVVFGDGIPGCDYEEMGKIVTSEERGESAAVDAAIAEAARVGASGIYKVQTSNGTVVGMSSSPSASASAQADVSIEAQAFRCRRPAPKAPPPSDKSAKPGTKSRGPR